MNHQNSSLYGVLISLSLIKIFNLITSIGRRDLILTNLLPNQNMNDFLLIVSEKIFK